MGKTAIKPKFVVDDSGKKSAVLLSPKDYERLRSAWEEIQDSKDFAEATRTAKTFASPAQLREGR